MDVTPRLVQVLKDQTSVASIGCCLAAEQHDSLVEESPGHHILDAAHSHQIEELLFVGLPIDCGSR